MRITEETTLKEIAVHCPTAMKVLDRLHIDYSCGGARRLADACRDAGLLTEDVIRWIGAQECREGVGSDEDVSDWTHEPLQALTRYITEKHHTFVRAEFSRLSPEVEELCQGEPWLEQIRSIFLQMRDELLPHMLKEEQILFPYINLMEEALAGRKPMPMPPFGSLQNPIRTMLPEHDDSAELFEELRKVTDEFQVPHGASIRLRALIRDLEGLEFDLQHHLHLENNILFPRAVQMERKAAEAVDLAILGASVGSC
jgi:regulator of cell morphogenesis and NO signaling